MEAGVPSPATTVTHSLCLPVRRQTFASFFRNYVEELNEVQYANEQQSERRATLLQSLEGAADELDFARGVTRCVARHTLSKRARTPLARNPHHPNISRSLPHTQ
jgi:hypothetical protein